MIIDAKDSIMGRVATYAAKQALLGQEVIIINVEKAVISGSKENVIKKYLWRDNLGEPFAGPFMPKIPMKFFKRVIRGMISYKKERGKLAYKRIKCYPGNPKNVQGISLENAKYTKLKKGSYITVEELCKHIKK
ncbi:MAG: 50S ribosomal protein L13 [Nanoarchaeota archaeon]|mgnify:CR=1 FL=1